MKTLLYWILTLALASGVETVAWNIPVDLVVQDGLKNARVVKLKEHPGTSNFFEDDDELWDLSSVAELELNQLRVVGAADSPDPFAPPSASEDRSQLKKVGSIRFKGGFLVWNPRTNQVVARGTKADVRFVDGWIDLIRRPKQVRTTLIFQSEKSVRNFVLMARSGENAEVRYDGVDLKLVPNLSADSEVVDMNIHLGLSHENSMLEVTTACTLNIGEKRRLSRWVENGVGCEVQLLVDVVYPWGALHSEIRLEEREGLSKRAVYDPSSLNGLNVGEDLQVRVFSVPTDLVQRICENDYEAVPWKVPEELKDQLPGNLLDIREPLKMNGVKFSSPLSMAGFDLEEGILVLVNDFENLEMVDMIVGHRGCGVVEVVEIEVSWDEHSLTSLTRSGEKMTISAKRGDQVVAHFEAAPNVGAYKQWIDVNMHLNASGGKISVNSAVTLFNGRSVDVVELSSDEKNGRITLTGTVVELDHEH